MRWLRRFLFIVGWGLILTSGWLKGGDEASPAVLLSMLAAGALVLIVVVGMRDSERKRAGNSSDGSA
jgi:hypothetical protein